MQHLCDSRLTESEQQLIKRKARKMAGHYGYRASDVEDLQQELALHVFQRTHLYRPGPAPREAWVSHIVDNKIRNLIEERLAQKRDRRRDVSLEQVPEESLLDAAQTPDQINLRLDLGAIIDQLPADLRALAELRPRHTEKELEGLLGLTRAQVRGRLQRLAHIFREAGLAPNSE